MAILLLLQAGNWFAAPRTTIDLSVWGLALLVYLVIAGTSWWVATNGVRR